MRKFSSFTQPKKGKYQEYLRKYLLKVKKKRKLLLRAKKVKKNSLLMIMIYCIEQMNLLRF
jgi:hypothetical protein